MMLNAISKLKVKTEKEQKQLELDAEIEKQGIIYGWESVNLTPKTARSKLKQLIIVRYKTAKVAKFILGNVLLCEKDGCFIYVEINQSLCKFHIKKNMVIVCQTIYVQQEQPMVMKKRNH